MFSKNISAGPSRRPKLFEGTIGDLGSDRKTPETSMTAKLSPATTKIGNYCCGHLNVDSFQRLPQTANRKRSRPQHTNGEFCSCFPPLFVCLRASLFDPYLSPVWVLVLFPLFVLFPFLPTWKHQIAAFKSPNNGCVSQLGSGVVVLRMLLC